VVIVGGAALGLLVAVVLIVVFRRWLVQLDATYRRILDQLFRLGQHLEARGGFVATVGALLCLTAVMHGAAGRRH
jgi:hypothetical protein